MKFIVAINFFFILYFTYERIFEITNVRFIDYVTSFLVCLSVIFYSLFLLKKSYFLFTVSSLFLTMSFIYFVFDAWLYPLGGVLYSVISSFVMFFCLFSLFL